MTNLAALLESSARRHAERSAIVLGDSALTYSQIDREASQIANLLTSRGVQPGDKVALSCPNIPAFTIIYYGILKAGATIVPLNVLLKAREIAYHLDDADAVAYFAYEGSPELPIGDAADQGFRAVEGCRHFFLIESEPTRSPTAIPTATAPVLSEALLEDQSPVYHTVDRSDDDTAVILYTSGTTGQPKGAELRHRNMRDNVCAMAAVLETDVSRPDTFLCVLPLFHSFGQTVVQNLAISQGGVIVMLPRFDAGAALRAMVDRSVTVFAGVPTMYWSLLRSLDEVIEVDKLARSLRVAISGGAALPAAVHHEFQERLGVTILEGYGLSETSPVASFSPLGEPVRPGSIGIPIPGVEMRLIDADWGTVPDDPDSIGEIAIKGHNVMKGYYERPEATREAISDGWFRSGDLAKRDRDGYYYVVDRAKDMIIRGGYNVYPREVEEALMSHPAVSLASVIGVPDEALGEEIKAVVIRSREQPDISEAELIAWSRGELAAYKYPRIVEFRDTLPTTATGKILKREI